MTTYRFIVSVDDDDRDQVDSKPWTATVAALDGEGVTVAAGLGEEPWEALADIEVDWTRVEDRS